MTTASETLRIAVIGAGFMGRQHIDFIRASSRVQLVAVVDPLATASSDVGAPVFADTVEMLDRVAPSAVVIANPNALHVETAEQCIDAGTAVLLEKPVADSYASALRLVDSVERRKARLLVGHHRRHHPAVTRARAALADGEIGQVVAVSGMWAARKDDAYFSAIPGTARLVPGWR